MTDKPATQAERDAISFQPVDVEFDWSNDEWALAHLPHVRMATTILQRDGGALQELIKNLAKDALVPDMLDGFIEVRDHLTALAALLDTAVSRSFLTLERLGYSPDSPPPEGTIQ